MLGEEKCKGGGNSDLKQFEKLRPTFRLDSSQGALDFSVLQETRLCDFLESSVSHVCWTSELVFKEHFFKHSMEQIFH